MKNRVICVECKNLYMHYKGNHSFAHCNEPDKEIVFSPVTGETIAKQYKLCVVKNKNANCKDFVRKPKRLHFLKDSSFWFAFAIFVFISVSILLFF